MPGGGRRGGGGHQDGKVRIWFQLTEVSMTISSLPRWDSTFGTFATFTGVVFCLPSIWITGQRYCENNVLPKKEKISPMTMARA